MSRDSWATPMPVYLALDREFDFVADICASATNAKHPVFYTEQEDALSHDALMSMIHSMSKGSYVWINPPYSSITGWVRLAIELQKAGIGTAMLVMADSSVGWYYEALQHCNEVREVIKGRLAFIDPSTGKPVGGNNKGSIFLIFDPYGRQSPPRRTYIERDELMRQGVELMVPTERMIVKCLTD